MHGLVFLLLCQPLLPDRLLAWESRSLVRRSINSYHANFAGRKSSAIRHPLSAVLVGGQSSVVGELSLVSVVRELLSGEWLCSFASCQPAGFCGERVPLWCMVRFAPSVSAVAGRQVSGVGESLSDLSFD